MDKKGIVDKTYFSKDEKVRELKSLEKELRIRGGKILYDFSKNQLANDYIKERFLTEEFLETFEIGYCTSVEICRAFKDSFRDPYLEFTKFRNRICIPIYEGSDLISIEGRDFTKRAKPKVLYPKGGSVSSLFNYHNLNKKEPLIVVEGIMDMPRIWQNITKNITTTFGINLTPRQKEQLKEFEHVIIFSDTDSAGRLMIKEFDDFMEKPYWIARLEDGDPGSPENSLDTIKNAIETAKESTEFLLDESELIESQDYNKNYFSV
jgi:DNA primase